MLARDHLSNVSEESSSAERDGPNDGGRTCPICSARLYGRHCKYVCPQHGVVIDCSDPFV